MPVWKLEDGEILIFLFIEEVILTSSCILRITSSSKGTYLPLLTLYTW